MIFRCAQVWGCLYIYESWEAQRKECAYVSEGAYSSSADCYPGAIKVGSIVCVVGQCRLAPD